MNTGYLPKGLMTFTEGEIGSDTELRDWFAGMALPAIIARDSDCGAEGEAHDAYLYADAMLKAREA